MKYSVVCALACWAMNISRVFLIENQVRTCGNGVYKGTVPLIQDRLSRTYQQVLTTYFFGSVKDQDPGEVILLGKAQRYGSKDGELGISATRAEAPRREAQHDRLPGLSRSIYDKS